MKKYIVEFIGTFFLVMTIGMCVMGGAGDMAPVAIGSALMVMVFAGGHISGAHYNPAVTLSLMMTGACPKKDVLPYMVFQAVGGVAGALMANYLAGGPSVSAMALDTVPTLCAEFLFTFGLCYVVLNTATAQGTKGNSFYGLAIGFTVAAGAYAVGPISGGVFNPAVAIGALTMGMANAPDLWMYLVANFVGGAAAASVFKYTTS